MFIIISLNILLYSVAFAADDSYWGYKVYDINAKNANEKEILYRLHDSDKYDFFDLPKVMGKSGRVMVSPEEQFEFETSLEEYGINFTVLNENIGQTIQWEREQNNMLRSVSNKSFTISFSSFQRYDDIVQYLDVLAKNYAHRVSVKTFGKSYEGRYLKSITITNGDGRKHKKVIFIDAGIHAREWIAPATALYVIYQLVENFERNKDLLRDSDWVIVPVVNPDGYEYTHTKNRFWRKNRKPSSYNCIGTDENRNFGYHWGEVGASNNPCSDIFMGQTPFSEPETLALRDALDSLSDHTIMYLTLHSYGNYLLYPWGYTSDLPLKWRDIDEVARTGATAIKRATGTVYTVGSSTRVLYAAAGGSDDYALGVANIPIAITMELPAGGSGFDPAPTQIKPFVSESWIGIRAMAERAIKKF